MAWALVDSWTYSTNVASVTFNTGLSGLTELLLLARGITLSSSGFRTVQFSADTGSTFYSTSGDYVAISDSGAETNATGVPIHTGGTTAARSGLLHIFCWNIAQRKPLIIPNAQLAYYFNQAAALDALKVFGDGGGNLTGGSLLLYGK